MNKEIEVKIVENLISVEEKYSAVSQGKTILIRQHVAEPAYKELIRVGIIKDNDTGWQQCVRLVWDLMLSLGLDRV